MQDYYNDNTAISKSGLDKIDSSPLDYWYHYLRPDRDSYEAGKQTIFDNALRLCVFSYREFKTKYVRTPTIDKRSNVGKAEFAALLRKAEMSNQILLSEDDYDKIISMSQAIKKHPTAGVLCGSGKIGMPVRFEEENTGAIIKFKPHFIHDNEIIVNLNSSKDVSLSKFQLECWNFRHDKKAYIQMTGLNLSAMVFLSIETEAPFKIGLRYLGERTVDFGRETVIKNCETYISCLESGIWPGIEEKITPSELPDWVFKTNNQ